MTADLHEPRITAMGLLAEAYAGLSCRFATQFAEHGLSPIEFEMLLRLARSPDGRLRMTDLATQVNVTTSGVTRVVDRLERGQLVERMACVRDRRSQYAVITRAGRQRLVETLPGHVALIDEWFTGLLDPDQLDNLLGALRVIRDAVRLGAVAGGQPRDCPDSDE